MLLPTCSAMSCLVVMHTYAGMLVSCVHACHAPASCRDCARECSAVLELHSLVDIPGMMLAAGVLKSSLPRKAE